MTRLRKVKNQILGENAARLFGLDINKMRQAAEADLLYTLRNDGNPLLRRVDWTKVRLPITF